MFSFFEDESKKSTKIKPLEFIDNRREFRKNNKPVDKKPKLSERYKKMDKKAIEDELEKLSDKLLAIYNVRKGIDTVESSAYEYDNDFFDVIGFDKCLKDSKITKKCYCAKCLMEEDISLDMISNNSNEMKSVKGKKYRIYCKNKYEPKIVKGNDHYYIIVECFKGFNSYLPINSLISHF